MKKKVIAITGTPGTGKTKISKKITRNPNTTRISITELVKDNKTSKTDKNKVIEVDPKDLEKITKKKIKKINKNKTIILEGHLSHLLSKKIIKKIIVLRTNPKILRERLKKRNYPKEKINTNVESEAIDVILGEAIKKHGKEKINEIDTTKDTVKESAKKVEKIIKGEKRYPPGSIDWLENYQKTQ